MWEQPVIEHGVMTKYNWVVHHPQYFILGDHTDIGCYTFINAKQGVVIEPGAQVGSHCSIYSVSTIDGKQGTIVLKKNCKIGTHSTIMPGVTVGENSIAGAYSFITCDIPDNEVWWGIPAVYRRDI